MPRKQQEQGACNGKTEAGTPSPLPAAPATRGRPAWRACPMRPDSANPPTAAAVATPPCLLLYLYASHHRSPRPGGGRGTRPTRPCNFRHPHRQHASRASYPPSLTRPAPATVLSPPTPNATSPRVLSRPRPHTRQRITPLPIPVLGLAPGPLTPHLILHTLPVAEHCMPARRTRRQGARGEGGETGRAPRFDETLDDNRGWLQDLGVASLDASRHAVQYRALPRCFEQPQLTPPRLPCSGLALFQQMQATHAVPTKAGEAKTKLVSMCVCAARRGACKRPPTDRQSSRSTWPSIIVLPSTSVVADTCRQPHAPQQHTRRRSSTHAGERHAMLHHPESHTPHPTPHSPSTHEHTRPEAGKHACAGTWSTRS